MAAPLAKNVLVGSENGIIKVVDIGKRAWDNVSPSDKPDRSQEINTFCWRDESENEAIFGLKNRKIKIFEIESQNVRDRVTVPGENRLRGLCVAGDRFVTGLSDGIINVWNYEDDTPATEFSIGGDLHRLRNNTNSPNIIATGGKENDLKLWDINYPDQPKFHAKNTPHDWLNLRVPIWVTDFHFLDMDKIVVCTGYHQIRLYDPRGPQRRPCLNFSFGEYPFTCMTKINENQVVVGDTVGKMVMMDLRHSGSMVQLYKEFGGGVTDVQFHPKMSCLVSTSLDRFLRIHDIHSKKLLHKFYMKSRLKSLLLSSEEWELKDDVVSHKRGFESKKKGELHSDDEDETDELWDNLQSAKKHKKSSDSL